MEKYVLHSYFYAMDINNVDAIIGYNWMKSIGMVNINVENNFL